MTSRKGPVRGAGVPLLGREFDSAWWKWAWATRHAVALEDELRAIGQDEAHRPQCKTVAVYEPENQAFALILDELSPLPVELSLRLGDVAHNYRSAFDHAAWGMVLAGESPEVTKTDGALAISFPVMGERAVEKASAAADPSSEIEVAFQKQISQRLPGVIDPHHITLVREMQPYLRATPGMIELHALAICQKFDNDDKHRQVELPFVFPTTVGFEVREHRDCTPVALPGPGTARPLHVGMNLGSVAVIPTGPQPELEVDVLINGVMGMTAEVNLIEWLDRIRYLVEGFLWRLAPPPLDSCVLAVLSGSGDPWSFMGSAFTHDDSPPDL